MQRVIAEARRGIERQKAGRTGLVAPARRCHRRRRTAVALMRAASRPQRRARGREKAATASARGRRDAVIIALAFCAGLRRSEIAALVWGDVTPSCARRRVGGPCAGPEGELPSRRGRLPAAGRRVRAGGQRATQGNRTAEDRPRGPPVRAPDQPPRAGPGGRARPRWASRRTRAGADWRSSSSAAGDRRRPFRRPAAGAAPPWSATTTVHVQVDGSFGASSSAAGRTSGAELRRACQELPRASSAAGVDDGGADDSRLAAPRLA